MSQNGMKLNMLCSNQWSTTSKIYSTSIHHFKSSIFKRQDDPMPEFYWVTTCQHRAREEQEGHHEHHMFYESKTRPPQLVHIDQDIGCNHMQNSKQFATNSRMWKNRHMQVKLA